MGRDARIDCERQVEIRAITDLKTGAKVLARNVYFDGGDVLRCHQGRFKFTLDEGMTIEIGKGEALCIFPGHRVTIEATEDESRLIYCILNGDGVVDYLNGLGFYDGLKGACRSQLESIQEIMLLLKSNGSFDNDCSRNCLAYLTDVLVTIIQDVRHSGHVLVIDAVRQIRQNLKEGIVRIDPLCDQLKVSHAYLHRMFVREGLGSPSEFIRREQLQIVLKLLRETRKPISEIAGETGFISLSHFANFIKHYVGKTAREIRHGL